jgi:hypothetical protein
MQRLYIGYTGHTLSMRCSGVVEKLWCDRCCCGYATRIYGPCFNNLARILYTAASGIYIPYIYILNIILFVIY